VSGCDHLRLARRVHAGINILAEMEAAHGDPNLKRCLIVNGASAATLI
jgi:hypothetical protein